MYSRTRTFNSKRITIDLRGFDLHRFRNSWFSKWTGLGVTTISCGRYSCYCCCCFRWNGLDFIQGLLLLLLLILKHSDAMMMSSCFKPFLQLLLQEVLSWSIVLQDILTSKGLRGISFLRASFRFVLVMQEPVGRIYSMAGSHCCCCCCCLIHVDYDVSPSVALTKEQQQQQSCLRNTTTNYAWGFRFLLREERFIVLNSPDHCLRSQRLISKQP